jgi:hypothetical protein
LYCAYNSEIEHYSPDCIQANSSGNPLMENVIENENNLLATSVIENNPFKTNVIANKNIIQNNPSYDFKCCQFYSDCVECLRSLYSDLSSGHVCQVLGHPVHLVECQEIT